VRSDELVTVVRRNCTIELNHPDYTDQVILDELNDALQQTFEQQIVAAHSGYWLKQQITTLPTNGKGSRVRIPARACSVEKVEISGADLNFSPLHQVTEDNSYLFEGGSSTVGTPQAYAVRGDSIVLMPEPDGQAYNVRVTYYLRPPRMYKSQSSVLGGDGLVRGQIGVITSLSSTITQFTVNVLPFDQSLAVPSAPSVSQTFYADVVRPNGWHEAVLVSGFAIVASSTTVNVTITDQPAGVTDDVNPADFPYLRFADQTDWPALPDDFHRCVADVASVKIMLQRNMAPLADQFASGVSADFARFGQLIKPRVRVDAVTVRPRLTGIRRGRWR
jgi:hypothetical protein